MGRRLAGSLLVLLFAASPAIAGEIKRAKEPIRDQYVVILNVLRPDVLRVAGGLARDHGGVLQHVYDSALHGFSVRMTAERAEALSRHPLVASVEEDAVVRLEATQTFPIWGLDRIDQRSLPLSMTYTYDQTGQGVTAYIIDSGIRFSHSEFGGRAASGPDFIDGGTADDCHGHGTHVAGTVGGARYGVAKAVNLVAVRVLDCAASGALSGVIAGIDWVTANHVAPAVANMSLGAAASDALDAAVRNSIASGVTYVVAAGNGDASARAVDACANSPARLPEAITVSASDRYDTKPTFANYGQCVDMFAPGVSIASSWNTGDTAAATLSGTSMATAHATGAAALYLEMAPGATPQAVYDALYAATTKSVVLGSLTENNHLLCITDFLAPVPPPNLPPVASFTVVTSGLTAVFTDTSGDGDGTIQSWLWNFGDGTTASVPNPTHTYAVGLMYTVTLTVTDNAGASATSTRSVNVTPPPATIALSVAGRIVKGKAYADLAWTGATGALVDVYRNGTIVATTANTGRYTNALNKLRGTFIYKVCASGTQTCSNQASITF